METEREAGFIGEQAEVEAGERGRRAAAQAGDPAGLQAGVQ